MKFMVLGKRINNMPTNLIVNICLIFKLLSSNTKELNQNAMKTMNLGRYCKIRWKNVNIKLSFFYITEKKYSTLKSKMKQISHF